MIARHEASVEKNDLWARLSAPLPDGVIAWRQDGRPVARDGKYFARFVAYIDANTVRERLDLVCPGEWDLTLELLPTLAGDDEETKCSFKARLQILGVIREDVGYGKDYKQASTDAFKRAAVRFGIAHELYSYGQNWVQVDGDSKFAKPVEDPADAYTRRTARQGLHVQRGGDGSASRPSPTPPSAGESTPAPAAAADYPAGNSIDDRAPLDNNGSGPLATDEPSCPKCGGRMWDNRLSKRNPKAPDFKCRNRSCDGVIWPPKNGKAPVPAPAPTRDVDEVPEDFNDVGGEELPF